MRKTMLVKSGLGVCFLGVAAMFMFCGDVTPSKEAAVRASVLGRVYRRVIADSVVVYAGIEDVQRQ